MLHGSMVWISQLTKASTWGLTSAMLVQPLSDGLQPSILSLFLGKWRCFRGVSEYRKSTFFTGLLRGKEVTGLS